MEAYPIPNQEATTASKKLVDEFFCRFSLPKRLHSDQGPQFESEVIRQTCKLLQIDKSRTTPYHPQSDGLIERFNRTLLQMLATCADSHPFEWEDHINKVCMAYNTSIHASSGYSPFSLCLGGRHIYQVTIHPLMCQLCLFLSKNCNRLLKKHMPLPTLTPASTKSGNETPIIEEHMDPPINLDLWSGYLIQKCQKGRQRHFTSLGLAHIRLLRGFQTIPTASRIPKDHLRQKWSILIVSSRAYQEPDSPNICTVMFSLHEMMVHRQRQIDSHLVPTWNFLI